MNYIWNLNNVKIGSITTNRWDGMQMWTSGFCLKQYASHSEVFQWEATALDKGWYIVITSFTGKVGEYQGVTFNLPLEVNAALNKFV